MMGVTSSQRTGRSRLANRARTRAVRLVIAMFGTLLASGSLSLVLAGPAEALGSPALTSIASPSTTVGLDVFDHATLTGGSSPTGTVTFALFGPNNPTCTGAAAFTATVSVNGAGNYDSPHFTTALAGTYQWVASYSGDAANNSAGPTSCADPSEAVIVGKFIAAISTTASPTVATGGQIHDTATLNGRSPTGTISFRLSGPADTFCGDTPVFTATVTVDAGSGSYQSPNFTPTVAGTYRWQASYSGDSNNQAIQISTCLQPTESVVVTSAGGGLGTPALTTSASASVVLGGVISDSAVLSGGTSPTGSIVFRVFGPSDASCAGTPVSTSTVAVSGDGTYPSVPFTPTVAGTYRFTAAYGGDAGNASAASACGAAGESVAVGSAGEGTTVLTTQASGGVRVGGQLTDTATLSGGASPTGTVTFSLFGPQDPRCAGPAIFTSVKATGSRSVTSNPFIPGAPGTYRWVASYSGDANGAPVGGTCSDANESTAVSPAQPALATSTPPTVAIGGSSSDTATLSGGVAPTGTLRFELYGPNDPACSSPIFRATGTVNGNGAYVSGPVTLIAQGVYYWVAFYSGDANNLSAASSCQSETVQVPAATQTVTTPPTTTTPAPIPTTPNAPTITQVCAGIEAQVDTQLPGQTISSALQHGFTFGLSAPASIEVRLVLRAKDPATGTFVSLANFLLHVSTPVRASQADNGLGANYARRARGFLMASERAAASLLVFKVVHCRPDKQQFSVESVGILSLLP
ncbi:MAG: hypothetical protein QOH12_3268 [Solirubrobacteraceae bacterium]|nr:hypothetical protein [Solirubrobacteraceae bacterium]